MKNNFQKGFVVPLVIAIVVILAAGGVYWGVKGKSVAGPVDSSVATTECPQGQVYRGTECVTPEAGTTNQSMSGGKNLVSPTVPVQPIADWKTYTNSKVGYSISYPPSYHVAYENDLFNYDENKYEKGNSNGVKIQIQNDYDTRFDTHTDSGFNALIASLNGNIKTNNQLENSNGTPISSFLLGIFKAKSNVLSGPGGAFDVYYAPKNSDHGYYRVLVWGAENDKDNVVGILSTFKFTSVPEKIATPDQTNNLQPSATSLTPRIDTITSLPLNSTQYVLKIAGANFPKNASVYFNRSSNAAANFFPTAMEEVVVNDVGTLITVGPVYLDASKQYPVRVINDVDSFIFARPSLVQSNEMIFRLGSSFSSKEQSLILAGKEVLTALKNKDYNKLEMLTSSDGLSFNIYPDSLNLTKSDVTKNSVSEIPSNTTKYMWGYTDGKGDPINLSISDYMNKWIYNHDYVTAPKIVVNQIAHEQGNTINNILKYSAGRDFVAFHFDGFDPKYSGMDWTTIYLIFDNQNGDYKLRGIVKANWTI